MGTTADFQIDRRVTIAMDALAARQRAALELVLQSKEAFVDHSIGAGKSKRLSSAKPLYVMTAGDGLRVFFSKVDDNIVVLDIMRKASMDRLAGKTKSASSEKKLSGNSTIARNEATKVHKS